MANFDKKLLCLDDKKTVGDIADSLASFLVDDGGNAKVRYEESYCLKYLLGDIIY